jgi:DNA-binding beta-propeller fold protein YncE
MGGGWVERVLRRAPVVGGVAALVVFAGLLIGFSERADAALLHSLTSKGCISDIDAAETCGGVNGGAGEGQGLDFPQDIAVSPDGASVYAVSQNDGAVVRFNRNANGTLTHVGCISDVDLAQICGGVDGGANETQGLGGADGIAISPDGTSVYVAGRSDSAIVRFSRDTSGALTNPSCISDREGAQICGGADGGPNEAQGLSGADAIAISPDGSSLYVGSLFDDAVVRFGRSPGGALTSLGCISDLENAQTCGGANGGANEAQGLNGVGGLAVSPDGASLYAPGEGDGAIVRFDRAADGTLTNAGCISDVDQAEVCGGANGGQNEAEGLGSAKDVAISPDGGSVYVGALQSTIAYFDRTRDGALSNPRCVVDRDFAEDCGGTDGGQNEAQGLNIVESIAISPDGQSLYAATSGESAVVGFSRATNGTITSTGCFSDFSFVCGPTAQGLGGGIGVAVSPDGTAVYVAGFSDDAVVSFGRELPPRCLATAASGPPGQAVTVPLDCVDPNGDATTIELADSPANGTLGAVNQANDTVAYTPNAGFTGNDTFSFRAISDGKESNIATAHIDIEPPQGQTGATGAQGPQGPTGPQGPAGPQGEPAIKLLALLASDKLAGKSGKSLAVRFRTSDRADATVDVKKGSRTVAEADGTATGQGVDKLSVKLVDGKTKLAKGNYTVELTVEGDDGQVAEDAARLKVK